jgi:hypothetical protein
MNTIQPSKAPNQDPIMANIANLTLRIQYPIANRPNSHTKQKYVQSPAHPTAAGCRGRGCHGALQQLQPAAGLIGARWLWFMNVICTNMYIYIYIYIKRERERDINKNRYTYSNERSSRQLE